jgi:hypothetical protein
VLFLFVVLCGWLRRDVCISLFSMRGALSGITIVRQSPCPFLPGNGSLD